MLMCLESNYTRLYSSVCSKPVVEVTVATEVRIAGTGVLGGFSSSWHTSGCVVKALS